MKNVLKIVAVVSGIVGLVSAVWLACLYMEDLVKCVEMAKNKVFCLLAKEK